MLVVKSTVVPQRSARLRDRQDKKDWLVSYFSPSRCGSVTSCHTSQRAGQLLCKQSGEPLEQPPGQCGNSTIGRLLQEKTGQALGSATLNVRPRITYLCPSLLTYLLMPIVSGGVQAINDPLPSHSVLGCSGHSGPVGPLPSLNCRNIDLIGTILRPPRPIGFRFEKLNMVL